jgi:succinyl-diaminopimelate desuccinylase
MNKLLELTKSLIRFKSTENRPEELERIVDFVENYFKKTGLFIRRFGSQGKPSIVVTFKKNKKIPKVFLNGHLDVIEAEDKDFIPRLKRNRLYGRGAGDMKGAVACLMEVMREFAKAGKKSSLGLMLTCDEEIGGENGVGFLLNKKGYKSNLVICPDGGSLFKIIIAEKGFFRFKIEAKGKSCHSSRPWKGDNAIEKLIEAYLEIKKMFPRITIKDNWKETINLGKFFGGEAVNKVPDFAEMELDIRFCEENNSKSIYQRISKIVSNTKGLKIKTFKKGSVLFTPKSNFYFKGYRKICENVLNKKVELSKEHGASDARYFAEKKIPVIIHMPNIKNIHAKNEWLDIKSQEKYYQILKKFLEKIFK